MTSQGAETPAPGGVGLLIIDMINDFAFEGGEDLLPKAGALAEVILGLRGQADEAGAPVIYVNDNYGQWRASRERIVAQCQAGEAGAVVSRIAPRENDLFVVKPQVSGFYATNLPVLLPKLGVNRIILTGVAADICILFTAADAHMRDYELWIPSNAVASEDDRRAEWALDIMRKSMDAETRSTDDLALAEWVRPGRDGS